MAAKDYTVGYRKPPVHAQFKTGQSGNAKGRPKGSRNLLTDLSAELSQKLVVTEGGRTIRISKQQAIIKALLGRALKGDVRAATALLRLIPASEAALQAHEATHTRSVADQAILDAFRQQVVAEIKSNGTEEKDQ